MVRQPLSSFSQIETGSSINSIGGRMRIEQSLLAESWNPQYGPLGFDRDAPDPPFLKPAVSELAKADGAG